MKKEYSYGIAPYQIMNGTYYVLLNKTSKNSNFNFFKGKTEGNESCFATALREFEEETGVSVEANDLESFFYQKSLKKDVGIFLLNWVKYKDASFNFQEKEIWSATWVPIMSAKVSRNQQDIMDRIKTFFENDIINIEKEYSD